MSSQDFDILGHFLKTFTFSSLARRKLAQKNLESGNDLLVAACKSGNNHRK